MRVLGIDPGLSRCGYGALDAAGPGGRGARPVAIGVLRTPVGAAGPDRLAELQRELRSLIDELRPDAVAVEKVFFQSNVRTAIGVAQASGLALAEAVNAGAVVAEYTPNQVKEAVAGWGGAGKEEVGKMVQALLGLEAPLRPADAADAAAVALCHLAHAPRLARVAAASGTVGGAR
jgi:crossover junction endodeoxyribonuclease RuvC